MTRKRLQYILLTLALASILPMCKKGETSSTSSSMVLNRAVICISRADSSKSVNPPLYRYPIGLFLDINADKMGKNYRDLQLIISDSLKRNTFYSTIDNDTLDLRPPYQGKLIKPRTPKNIVLAISFDELTNNFDSLKYGTYKEYMEKIVNNGKFYYHDQEITKANLEIKYQFAEDY
jgi:hypothetical protein